MGISALSYCNLGNSLKDGHGHYSSKRGFLKFSTFLWWGKSFNTMKIAMKAFTFVWIQESLWNGIGGTVKMSSSRASLQAAGNKILIPHDWYGWARDGIHGFEFFFVMQDQVQENSIKFKFAEW